MSHSTPRKSPWRARAASLAAATLLAACGGGYSDGGGLSCSVGDEKIWLRDYMNDWYYWYAISPNPSPDGYPTVDSYFNALLYTGSDTVNFPKADEWSYMTTEEAYNRTFGDGVTLGWGVAVTGVEAEGDSTRPLWVRYVDPGSPAEAAGVTVSAALNPS